MHESIKIVRLQSGEDIIASYVEDNETETVLLKDPMTVMFKRLPTGASIMMVSPWLPIELIKENTALIYTSDILTIFEPYYKMVDNMKKFELSDENRLRKHLEEIDDDIDEEYDDEDVEEMMEVLKERKASKLH
jgi:hypothetical protein